MSTDPFPKCNIPSGSNSSGGPLGFHQAHGRVLVVDDDRAFADTIGSLLKSCGYFCDVVYSAEAAIVMLNGQDYDLLLSDIRMPDNEDLKLIRNVPQIVSGLPVILMTAYPTVDTAIKSVQLRVAAYLVKPFSKEELIAHVKPAILNYRALRLVRAGERRVEEWRQALQQVGQSLEAFRQKPDAAWKVLLDLTLRNAADAVADARVFSDMVAMDELTPIDTERLNSTRPVLLLKALYETLVVIDKTRTAFKSKDLAELRKKITPLLAD
jgi:DNA-binding response OmpR family regulator